MTDDAEDPGYRHKRWSKHLEEIDLEIAKLATICKVPLLDPGVIERVQRKDSLVCGTQNPRAFEKLRSLLMMHYSVRDKALVALGEDCAKLDKLVRFRVYACNIYTPFGTQPLWKMEGNRLESTNRSKGTTNRISFSRRHSNSN